MSLIVPLMIIFFSMFLTIGLSEFYFRYRYKQIMKYLQTHPTINFDYKLVLNAQRRFWVWPIRKAFK